MNITLNAAKRNASNFPPVNFSCKNIKDIIKVITGFILTNALNVPGLLEFIKTKLKIIELNIAITLQMATKNKPLLV